MLENQAMNKIYNQWRGSGVNSWIGVIDFDRFRLI